MNAHGHLHFRFSRHAAEWAVVAAAGLLIVAVIAAAWLSYRNHSTAEREFVLNHADDMALVLQGHARNTLLGVDDAVRYLKRIYERDGMRTDIALIKQGFSGIADAIAVMSVADDQGRLILSNLPIPPGAGIADLAHFRVHVERDTGKPFVNKPVLGRVSGKWSFHLTRRINKPDGSFGGVAIIAVDLSYWDRLLQAGRFGAADVIALVGRDGIARAVFVNSANHRQALMQADWTSLVRAADAEAGRGGGIVELPIGGATAGTWAYREVGDFPLLLAVSVDKAGMAARLGAVRAWYIGGTIAIVMLSVLLTAGLLSFLVRQRRHATERARIADEMRLNEERYRSLFDINPLPMLIRDEHSLAILAVNQAMVDKYGYSREQFAELTSAELISAATRDDYIRDAAARPPGLAQSTHRTHVTRDGTEIEVDATSRPILLDGKRVRLIAISDVTERLRSERAVRDSEGRLRTIADHVGEGLALFDRNDCLVFFNEPYRRMQALPDLAIGWTYERIVRQRAQVLLEMGEISDVAAFVRERLAQHGKQMRPVERRRPDGGYHLIRDTRTADGQTIVTFTDITDLKRREADLRSSEQRFRAMFDHAGIGISTRSALDRHSPWLAVNDKFCEMTGYSRAELLRMSTADITRAEGQDAAIFDNQRLLADEISSYAREKQIIRKDGSHLWVNLSVAMLPDAEGKPYRIIATYQDINARKLAEDRLRESEGWYRAMIDYAGVGIATRPAHDRQLPWLAVNDKFCEMTGYSRDELLKVSTVDITVPEEQRDAIRDNQRLLAGEVSGFSREKQLIRKDGSRLWTAMSVTLLPDAEGRPYRLVAIYQDIHARKLAEERVRESEGRLRAIIEAEPECVATVAPDGALLEMNPAGLRMLGARTFDEVRQRPLIRYVIPGHRRAFIALHRQILSGNSGMLEFEAMGLTGKRCWLEIHAVPLRDASGKIMALLGIARDVTERRTARVALAAERNLLHTVIENLPDRIRAKDRDGRLIMANAAWLRARAPGRDSVIGLKNADVLSAEFAAFVDAEDRQVLETGQPSPPREVMDGTTADPRWYVTTKMPLRDSAGGVIGIVGISRDVTDIKLRSLEVGKLNAVLEQRVAERTAQLSYANEELEAFAASVSHDLRAPLRHIDGMAAALTEDYGGALAAGGQHMLGRIRTAASRMSQLIEDLLSLSRVARAELAVKEVDVGDMARAIIDDLRRENPDRTVVVSISPALRATADPGLLRTALANLLQNAWKFTGNIPEARIEVGSVQRRGTTVFFVRDNGAGFDMGRAERLFGAFQRLHTDREFPGTGVGLATVRRVMRRHGGDAWAESAVDRGAIFFFTLTGTVNDRQSESEDTQAVPSSARQAVIANANPGVCSVLLVDDDPDVLTLSARALRPDGYEVLTAGTGEEAVEILRARAVGVIVSDFSMPGMNGALLLAQAAKLYPATLRIIVSGQEMNRAMQTGLNKGEIHHYFGKEYGYEPVRAFIRAWLAVEHRPAN